MISQVEAPEAALVAALAASEEEVSAAAAPEGAGSFFFKNFKSIFFKLTCLPLEP